MVNVTPFGARIYLELHPARNQRQSTVCVGRIIHVGIYRPLIAFVTLYLLHQPQLPSMIYSMDPSGRR